MKGHISRLCECLLQTVQSLDPFRGKVGMLVNPSCQPPSMMCSMFCGTLLAAAVLLLRDTQKVVKA